MNVKWVQKFDFSEAPLPFKSQGINFTTTKESSKIVVEKQNIVTKGMISPSSRSNLSNSNLSNQAFPPLGGEGTPKLSQGFPVGGDTTPKSTQVTTSTPPGAEKMETTPASDTGEPSTPSKVINVSIQVSVWFSLFHLKYWLLSSSFRPFQRRHICTVHVYLMKLSNWTPKFRYVLHFSFLQS